jgi:hypothetical protein
LEGHLEISDSDLERLNKSKIILRKLGSFSIKIKVKHSLLISHIALIIDLLNILWSKIRIVIKEFKVEEGKDEERSAHPV